MLKPEENELVTRVGPGTPMGDLFRQYWLPFMYSWELAPDGDPQRVRLLGEDLVAFRDSQGRVGLLEEGCPHRLASLYFGRNEEQGLRCVYHGWKFDVAGQCLDMPTEPASSSFKERIRAVSYRTAEAGGVVWAYLGPHQADPPGLPQYEWTLVPDDQRLHSLKMVRDCNWLQSVEGDLDSAHLFVLHSRLKQDATGGGFFHPDLAPHLEVVETEAGVMYGSRRNEDGEHYYWRVTQFCLPCFNLIPAREDGTIPSQIWVPIDDGQTLNFFLMWNPERVPDPRYNGGPRADQRQGMPYQEPTSHAFGAWRPLAQRDNDFLQDRAKQRTESMTGIPGVPIQDSAVTVSMTGRPIVDRSREHLGSTDAAIIRVRRRLIAAARALREQGTIPPGVDDPSIFRRRTSSAFLRKDADWVALLDPWHRARAPFPEGLGTYVYHGGP
jgi:phthalate 4,5-dioxygenase